MISLETNKHTDAQNEFLIVAPIKALRYQAALLAIESNPLCQAYINFKATFKAFAQEEIKEGATATVLKESANERLQSDDVTQNYGKKVTRYEKKMKKGQKELLKPLDRSVKTFADAERVFKEKFEAVHNDPTAAAIYREFRIAKKGLPDDPNKYVGFFKFLKSKTNRPIVREFAEQLIANCKNAHVTHKKIYKKIETASKAEVSSK